MSSTTVYYKHNVPIPEKDAREIATRAAQIVSQTAPRGEKNSRALVRATWQEGSIGLVFPDKASHLLYLDKGVKPFIMYELEGKTIPIRGKDGKLAFRRAKNVGKWQILTRSPQGQIRTSKIRWRHPGIAPQNFVEKAFAQAIREYAARLKGKDIIDIMQTAEGEVGLLFNSLIDTDSPEYQNTKIMEKYVPSTRKNRNR